MAAAPLAVIACGALAHEIVAIVRANGLDHMRLHCLPAILHNHPERIAPRVEAAIVAARKAGAGDVLVAYGDCGTGGALARVAERHGAAMLPGAHCYAFFEGVERFAARDEIDAFYLTDFLALHFESFVVRPLKLREHPELRTMMFAHYGRVVHLAQRADPQTDAAAQAAADFLALPLERRQTGYGALRDALQPSAAAGERASASP